jgi:hypothetical protein
MDRVKQRRYLHLASAYFMERYGQTQAKAEALVWPLDRVLRYVPMAAL